jgi:peroxiredoxin Q/BCP
MTHPLVGKPAPDFSLPNEAGNTIRLGDFLGQKVVLYFYPKAMTPGCTVQACGIRDSIDQFKARGAVVLGISPDPSARLQKFIDKYDLAFSLLSDEDHSVAEAYNCWGMKKFMGKEYEGLLRTTFIIDADGVVIHVIDKVKTKSHHDDVLALLAD